MKAAKDIVAISKELHQIGVLAAADGNISVRLDDSHLLITPSGVPKRLLQEEDLVVVNGQGKIIDAGPRGRKPSSELAMHLEIFRRCPLAQAVIHAHPRSAIAWTLANPQDPFLPSECMSEIILATGGIPIALYARSGTEAMGSVLSPFLPRYRALILARHGGIAWGEDLFEAFNGIERMEHAADTLIRARSVGPLSSLPPEEVEVLHCMRQRMGERTC